MSFSFDLTATSYELRMASRIEDIVNDFGSQTLVTDDMDISGGSLTSPSTALETEKFEIAVPTRGIHLSCTLQHLKIIWTFN